ncbi:hypothetical protein CHS0354_022805 [Potamilus streckersoni]|uniref:Uncharacterized protein n=1 Tax=Potamilus streckersoni TaxID=2493646 RepID=A0AAE0VMW5_9BIVA|nr:hypothetical protein CHS0354_022805 [Potamilus streckersoni]
MILKCSLGADHDGEKSATACNPDDWFIMNPKRKAFHPHETYSKNPWLFSHCSVEAFKKTLAKKDCVTRKSNYTKAELDDLNKLDLKLPGEENTLNMQCQIIMGRGSVYCGVCTKFKCHCAQDVCSIISTITFSMFSQIQ